MTCDYRDPCSCGYVDPDPEATKAFRERWSAFLNEGKPAPPPSLVFAPAVSEAYWKRMKHSALLGEQTYRRRRPRPKP